MSLHSYTVAVTPNGDVQQIMRDDNRARLWSDPDFQSWNAAQPTPFTLSARQLAVARLKTALKNGTWNSVSPADKDLALQFLIDRVFPEIG